MMALPMWTKFGTMTGFCPRTISTIKISSVKFQDAGQPLPEVVYISIMVAHRATGIGSTLSQWKSIIVKDLNTSHQMFVSNLLFLGLSSDEYLVSNVEHFPGKASVSQVEKRNSFDRMYIKCQGHEWSWSAGLKCAMYCPAGACSPNCVRAGYAVASVSAIRWVEPLAAVHWEAGVVSTHRSSLPVVLIDVAPGVMLINGACINLIGVRCLISQTGLNCILQRQ